MDTFIHNAIAKYFNTLSLTGTINKSDKWKLFTVSTVYSMYKAFSKLIKKEDSEAFNRYIDCMSKNSCLFEKSVPCLSYNTDSLITIIDSDVITDTSGMTMVSTQRKTKKFTDFNIKTEVEADQYVVGFDQSENNEVAINVNDLGVFWEVDI